MSDYIFKKLEDKTIFVGNFEELYRSVDDPWGQSNSSQNRDLEMAEFYTKSREKLLSQLVATLESPESICEIGCGTGHLTKLIADRFPECVVTGCDISQTAVLKARKSFGHVEFFEHDILANPLHSPVRVVILSNLLWYVLHIFDQVIVNSVRSLVRDSNQVHIVIQNALFRKGQPQIYGSEIVRSPGDLLDLIETALSVIFKQLSYQHKFLVLNDSSMKYDFVLSIVSLDNLGSFKC
jgi:SAM-dependent methyltransferase